MAQPNKGQRRQITPRLAAEVYAEVQRRAQERGMSTSQYVADVMAAHVGRPDLIRELNRTEEALPLAM
ncbi:MULTISPECIES: toxin-antitoxin system [Mycobacteriaceae]|uniref:Toxin-antitoxin system n=1 Tax=Mycolicibacillus parakoreensis TaxID=1069221 RepID=A0ABY3U497_9MYCO|nr:MULTISPECIES: toxin-antitoxin system [Mycobacteriaceae]MCV7316207.1 toxin-antitoxin system [Mycolicibacillus parakoreensis]ULN54800.1 toxin-antitoxin system [Mycolicibacillus parakoreensis]